MSEVIDLAAVRHERAAPAKPTYAYPSEAEAIAALRRALDIAASACVSLNRAYPGTTVQEFGRCAREGVENRLAWMGYGK